MLSYLNFAFKSLCRNRFSSILNITGLSLGLTIFLLILLYVIHEFSTNQFHRDADRIYCISIDGSDRTPYGLGTELMQKLPEIDDMCRVQFWDFKFNALKAEMHQPLDLDQIIRADENFFSFFSYRFITGNPVSSLQRPESIVLTKSSAVKLFGDENPLGKTIHYNRNQLLLEVTGIIEDPPLNSSFRFNAVMSANSLPVIYPPYQNSDPGFWSFNTFIKLKSPADEKEANKKLSTVTNQAFIKSANSGTDKVDDKFAAKLHPLNRLYFDTTISSSYFRKGNLRQIYIFSSVAILVLLVSVINSINLFGAQTEKRLHEMRVRKITGAGFRQIFWQMMIESWISAFFSILVALILTGFAMAIINSWGSLFVPLYFFSVRELLLIVPAGTFLTGLLVGLYPLFYLYLNIGKDEQPRTGAVKEMKAGTRLLVLQLVISVMLIIATATMLKQFNFMMKYDLGIDEDRIICLKLNKDIFRNYNSFVTALHQNALIEKTALANEHFMVRSNLFPIRIKVNGIEYSEEFNVFVCDTGFIEVLGLKWLMNKDQPFNKNKPVAAVINETAYKHLNVSSDEAVFFPDLQQGVEVAVAGVVNDFNYMPLHELQGPFLFEVQTNNQNMNSLYIRLKDDNKANLGLVLNYINDLWIEYSPDEPAEIKILGDIVRNFYTMENFQRKIFAGFSLFALVISCLGLYGLTVFIIHRKTKEIGIRKVNGAGVLEIIKMLNLKIAWWVLLAFCLAILPVYYFMKIWLSGFAYKTEISWWIFFMAGLMVFLLSMLTVSLQSLRAASLNPVDALKYE